MIELELPLALPSARELHVGDRVSVNGVLYTCSVKVLEYMKQGNELPIEPGSLVYHSSPVGKKRGKKWSLSSLAPEHAPPMESYLRELQLRYGVRGFVGRGELGPKTIDLCRQGSIYMQSIGGAGLLLAKRVKEVRQVHLTEHFDARDALWEIEVEDFPAVVMIDCHGQSLNDIVRDVSRRRLQNLQLK